MQKIEGYRLLWLQVIFDLPVLKPVQRKQATQFRNHLLDLGFSMCQFSVYMRHCKDKEQAETFIKKVERLLPEEGQVYILTFTDKQYENMKSFNSRVKSNPKSPDQLLLF